MILLLALTALAANGDYDHCDGYPRPNNLTEGCGIGEGDCDRDDQCAEDLVCGSNNGIRYGMPSSWDVCWPPHCENRVQDADETGVDLGGSCQHLGCPRPDLLAGDVDYCGPECPCPTGLGGCTTDADCADGGVCAPSWGDHFGFDAALSVCVPAHCTDGVLSGDETGPDDGGACGVSGACTSSVSFADADGDDFGDPATATVTCAGAEPAGYVLIAQDCDDATPTTYPYALEECDGVDNDCDGYTDVYLDRGITVMEDGDGDGQLGDPAYYTLDRKLVCEVPPGWLDRDTSWHQDCVDEDPAIYYDAALPDICEDGLDTNCDGVDGTCGDYGDVDIFARTSARWTRFDGTEWPSIIETDFNGTAAIVDFDGDGRAEVTYTLELDQDPSAAEHFGFAVLATDVTVTGAGHIIAESQVLTPAASPFDLYFRDVSDYDGDGVGDISYVADTCGVETGGPARVAFGPFVGSSQIRSAPAATIYAQGDATCGLVRLLDATADLDGDGSGETIVQFHRPYAAERAAIVSAPLGPGVSMNVPGDAITMLEDDPLHDYLKNKVRSISDDFDGDGAADLILRRSSGSVGRCCSGRFPAGW